MSDFVPKRLEKAAATFRERNAVYGSNYERFGKLMLAFFPGGLSLQSVDDFNRIGVFFHIADKLSRYANQFKQGGHEDSLDDISVYSMILQELDNELARKMSLDALAEKKFKEAESKLNAAEEVERMRGTQRK